MLQHVLLPLDESPFAETAIPYAKHIISKEGKITFMAVIDVPAFPYMLTPGPYPVPVENGMEEYERMLKDMSERAREYLHRMSEPICQEGYQAGIRVVAGNPAESIISAAEELNVDAIVMSTHGRAGLSRFVFGSVTQKVLHNTHRPVLVVRPSE